MRRMMRQRRKRRMKKMEGQGRSSRNEEGIKMRIEEEIEEKEQ